MTLTLGFAGADSILLWSFYGFRPKTVRSWDGNRMFLVRKPYGFGTENVKRRLLETETKAFHPTLIHSLLNKVTGKLNMNIRILP